jgi:hypothetical protein
MSDTIIRNLIYLKAGYPIEKLAWSMYLLQIRCPLCDGDGIFDWIDAPGRGHLKRSFNKLEGNMDIYWIKAVPTWHSNITTHTDFLLKDNNLYKNPANIIKCSQRRYRGIKLNESVLSMRVHHLENLENKIDAFYKRITAMRSNQINRGRIVKEMSSLGLSEFLPDKFAYPGPDDLPVEN